MDLSPLFGLIEYRPIVNFCLIVNWLTKFSFRAGFFLKQASEACFYTVLLLFNQSSLVNNVVYTDYLVERSKARPAVGNTDVKQLPRFEIFIEISINYRHILLGSARGKSSYKVKGCKLFVVKKLDKQNVVQDHFAGANQYVRRLWYAKFCQDSKRLLSFTLAASNITSLSF